MVVLECILKKDLIYNKVTPTFFTPGTSMTKRLALPFKVLLTLVLSVEASEELLRTLLKDAQHQKRKLREPMVTYKQLRRIFPVL
jgi:hypothetical protein